MKRLLALCIGVAATFGLAAGPALAKGEAGTMGGSFIITGPGLAQPIQVSGVLSAGPYGASPKGVFSSLVVGAGLIPTIAGYFGSKPDGELGPRYLVTTTVDDPGVAPIHQDLYPFAKGGPVFFNPPAQTGVWGNPLVSSWWYPPASLVDVLISRGLPVTPPSIPAPAGHPVAKPAPQPAMHGGTSKAWIFLAVIGALALLLAAGAFVGRQRAVRVG